MNEENTPVNEKKVSSTILSESKNKAIDTTSLLKKEQPSKDDEPIVDEQWAALTQDWQAQPVQKTDVVALLKQTKRRMLWAKVFLGLNIFFTVVVLIAFVVGLYSGEYGTPVNTFLAVSGVGSAVFVYYEIKIRLKTWQQCSDSPDKAIDNAIAVCQSSINYMILNKLSCIPFAVMGNWIVPIMALENDKPMWKGLLFVNFFLIVVYVVADKIHKKRKKEYNRLSALK